MRRHRGRHPRQDERGGSEAGRGREPRHHGRPRGQGQGQRLGRGKGGDHRESDERLRRRSRGQEEQGQRGHDPDAARDRSPARAGGGGAEGRDDGSGEEADRRRDGGDAERPAPAAHQRLQATPIAATRSPRPARSAAGSRWTESLTRLVGDDVRERELPVETLRVMDAGQGANHEHAPGGRPPRDAQERGRIARLVRAGERLLALVEGEVGEILRQGDVEIARLALLPLAQGDLSLRAFGDADHQPGVAGGDALRRADPVSGHGGRATRRDTHAPLGVRLAQHDGAVRLDRLQHDGIAERMKAERASARAFLVEGARPLPLGQRHRALLAAHRVVGHGQRERGRAHRDQAPRGAPVEQGDDEERGEAGHDASDRGLPLVERAGRATWPDRGPGPSAPPRSTPPAGSTRASPVRESEVDLRLAGQPAQEPDGQAGDVRG